MSTNSHQESDGYARTDWWGEPEVRTAANNHHDHGTDWGDEEIVDDKAESVAHMVLRGVAPKLCRVSIDDPAKTPTELTEPKVRPHGDGNRTHLRDARVNEEEGYISGGESTGVRLGDLPTEQFYDVIEILLAYWETAGHIGSDETGTLMSDARAMKQSSDITDAEAVERLTKDVLSP